MNQPRFPDPARSRAVLIGASHFTAGPDLPDIPAVQANLTALRQALTNPDTGVLRPEACRVLIDPTSADEVGAALSDAAATATDLLLVYYAGHGLVDDDSGRLHLALARTQPHRARWTALPFDLLREEIANSAATTRVLVLDCCFSGRAIEAMSDDQGVISGQLEVAGTYTLTSAPANAPSHAPVGDRHTAFTGALLRALDYADPLTLDQIFVVVDRDLVARNLPRPQRRAVNTAGNLTLSHGPTTRPRTEPPDSDEVRFAGTHSARHVLLWVFRAVFGGLFWFVLRPALFLCIFIFLLLILGKSIYSVVESTLKSTDSTAGTIWMAILLFFLAVLLIKILTWLNVLRRLGSLLRRLTVSSFRGFVRFASSEKEVQVQELVVNRSGLTIRRKGTRTHLPWRDIAQIGVLQPHHGALNRRLAALQHKRTHVLAVRLRPEIPAPGVVSVLSDEHRQLGYLGLCTLEGLGSSRQELASALERFAGGKLVHSSRQFLDRDPRLRPEMV